MEINHKFEPGCLYHEIMRANADGLLFKDRKDHLDFLIRLRKFILPCSEIICYALLGNHVHLLLRPHPPEVLSRISKRLKYLDFVLQPHELDDYLEGKFHTEEIYWPGAPDIDYHERIVSSIRSLKASYKMLYRHKYNHKGVLWGRDKVTKLLPEAHDIVRTIVYIHKNPVHHGLIQTLEEWEFSSYWEIVNQSSNIVRPESAMAYMGTRKDFEELHKIEPGEWGRKSKLASK